jgi:GNAT superfamily N-acetyltransferase
VDRTERLDDLSAAHPGGGPAFLGGGIVDRHEVLVAEEVGVVVGFAGLGGDMLDYIYVDPDAQNRAIGSGLLDRAKQMRRNGLRLWVFQRNDGPDASTSGTAFGSFS